MPQSQCPIASQHGLAWLVESLPEISAERIEGFASRTMGQLVRESADSLVAVRRDDDASPDPARRSQAEDVLAPWFATRHTVETSAEGHAQVQREWRESTDRRNDLVHHLSERHDLSTADNCIAALGYLDDSDRLVERGFATLVVWARGMEEAERLMGAFIASRRFEDAFVHGIAPDGRVDWPRATIVECLREAEAACSTNGWTALEAAVRHMRAEHPEQTPERYGCRRWRQVLNESRQFDLRMNGPPASGDAGVVYRSRLPQALLLSKRA